MSDPRPWRLVLVIPLVVSLVLFAIPQYFFISTSFHPNLGYGKIGDTLTLQNYVRVFTEPLYLSALGRTFTLSAATAVACLLIGFPVAYVLARSRSRWTSLLLGLLVAATFITPVVKDLGLIIILSQSGMLNTFLGAIGVISAPVAWLGTGPGVVMGLLLYTLPLMVLLLHTVIQTIPNSLEDAAHVHGASRMGVYFGIIIPLIKPGLVAATLMVFNLAAGAFTTPALLGGGRVLVFSILIQRTAILDVDYPFAAALSTVLLVFVFTFNLVGGYYMLKQSRRKVPRAKPDAGRPAAASLSLKGA